MAPNTRRGKQSINLTELENCLGAAQKTTEKLLRAVRSLPKVDQNGNSECPFARELYVKKEELEKEVTALLRQLEEYQVAIEKLIQSSKQDLLVVSARADLLNGDSPRAHFSDAEGLLASAYKNYLRFRNCLHRTIKMVREVLAAAAAKPYPGPLPGSQLQMPSQPGDDLVWPKPYQELGGADRELSSLFALDYSSKATHSQDSGDTD